MTRRDAESFEGEIFVSRVLRGHAHAGRTYRGWEEVRAAQRAEIVLEARSYALTSGITLADRAAANGRARNASIA